jgi:hypothetical protein
VMNVGDLVLNCIVHGVKRLGGDVAATHLRLKDLRRNSPK